MGEEKLPEIQMPVPTAVRLQHSRFIPEVDTDSSEGHLSLDLVKTKQLLALINQLIKKKELPFEERAGERGEEPGSDPDEPK